MMVLTWTALAFASIQYSEGEKYNFYLNISDILDPEWVYAEHSVGTKIQCASLCFSDTESCFHFGYKDHECKLLTDSIDEKVCSIDSCSDPGMKIYKLRREDLTAKPHDEETITTDAITITTTTEAITTSTTTTTEAATTTSTTTEKSTTTEIPTAKEPFECKPPKAAEGELKCDSTMLLLRAMGSRSPFFKDVLGATCTNMKEQVFDDKEVVEQFFSPDGGMSLTAHCPNNDDVVVKFKLCVKDFRIPAITLHCNPMKDKDRMKNVYNVTSDEMKHTLVDCGENGAIQKMFFEDSGDDYTTRVIFTCVLVEVKDDGLPSGV